MISSGLRDSRVRESVLAFAMAVGLAGCVVVISDDGVQGGGPNSWGESHNSKDDMLAKTVEDGLRADPLLKSADLKASARDGVVTLRGEVDGTERFDRAIQLTKATPGVDKVISKLKVEVR